MVRVGLHKKLQLSNMERGTKVLGDEVNAGSESVQQALSTKGIFFFLIAPKLSMPHFRGQAKTMFIMERSYRLNYVGATANL